MILGLITWSYSIIRELMESDHKFFAPLNYKKVNFKPMTINNQVYYYPADSDRCWDAPLPCTPYKDRELIMLGDEIGSGFKIPN